MSHVILFTEKDKWDSHLQLHRKTLMMVLTSEETDRDSWKSKTEKIIIVDMLMMLMCLGVHVQRCQTQFTVNIINVNRVCFLTRITGAYTFNL